MVEDSKEADKEQQQQLNYTRNSIRNEDFTRTIAKISVAQICENEGFQGFQQSALESLSDIAIRYIKELGNASNHYANLAGRSQCNVFDLIQGLEDLGLVQGFPAASDVHHSLPKSGVIREINQYVNFVENVPFVFDVPEFSVCKQCELSPSFSQLGEEPPGEHIPPWLPAFPRVEIENRGVEIVKDEPKEEKSVARDKGEVNNLNPFLASPLKYGDKEVGLAEPPTRFFVRNHGDMMEAFGRMSECYGMPKELSDVDVKNDGDIMSVERPIVRFKLRNNVKKRNEKLGSCCFSIEEEIDEKASCVEETLTEFSEMQKLDSS